MYGEKLRSAKKLEEDLQWYDAAKIYNELLESNETIELLQRAAWCYSRAEKYNKAIKYLTKLHDKEPEIAKWKYMLGYQYYSQKKWNEAIKWFEEALEKKGDYFVAKYRLAYAYAKVAGQYKKLTKPEYWRAIGHLKDCHQIWQKFDENKKQKEWATYFDINFFHGKLLMDLPNHYNTSISLFLNALKIKPDDINCKYNLAKTFYYSGNYEKARSHIPESPKYYVKELDAYIKAKLGNYEESIKIISQLLRTREKDYLYNFLAEVYLIKGDLFKAFCMAAKAGSIGKSNHKNHYILAKIYYHFGLYNKTIISLEKAQQLKFDKYGTEYNDANCLLDITRKKMLPGYTDDEVLINKLQNDSGLNKTECIIGTIIRYNPQKGYGFIDCNKKDIFFHISNCNYKAIVVNDIVSFKLKTTDNGLSAFDISCNVKS